MHFLKSSFTAVFISLLLSACGNTPQAAVISDAKERPDGGSEQSRRVQTTVANQKDIEQLAVVTGTLAADQEVVMGFKVPGPAWRKSRSILVAPFKRAAPSPNSIRWIMNFASGRRTLLCNRLECDWG